MVESQKHQFFSITFSRGVAFLQRYAGNVCVVIIQSGSSNQYSNILTFDRCIKEKSALGDMAVVCDIHDQ
jgi:hypothetical protein